VLIRSKGSSFEVTLKLNQNNNKEVKGALKRMGNKERDGRLKGEPKVN
jgi:hypothetical protein